MLHSFQPGFVTGIAGVGAVLLVASVILWSRWMVISCVHCIMPFYIIIFAFVNHYCKMKNAVRLVLSVLGTSQSGLILSDINVKGINHETVMHMYARREKWSRVDEVVGDNNRFVFSLRI